MKPSDPTRVLTVEKHGPALWLTLDRPAAFNSLTPQLVVELDQGLTRAESDSSIHCVVITGNGKAFCAGADLKVALAGIDGDSEAQEAAVFLAFVASVVALTMRIEHFAKPVIAAINGVALAGGLELVLACDLIVAVESARLGDAHANYGFMPAAGSSVRLPARVGINRANYLMFTGESLSARQLQEWGLVNEVVADGQLFAAVSSLAEKIASKSPLGLARMKRLMRASADQSLEAALHAEQIMSQLHFLSFDRREGVAAFAAKRAPRFKGC